MIVAFIGIEFGVDGATQIILAIAIGTAMILATGFCYAMYGREFLFQTFIFHFMKGRTDLLFGDGVSAARSSTSSFHCS